MKPSKLRSITGRSRERKVFASPRSRPQPAPWRQGLEGLLLLLLGIAVLAFLSWLPQRIDALVVVSEAIADLIRGLGQLLEALLGIGAVIVLALLLLIGLLALVGGSVRVCRSLVRAFAAPAARPKTPSVLPSKAGLRRRRSGRSS